MKKRLFELSALNVLLCLLVMFIHISSEAIAAYTRESVQFAALLSLSRAASFVVQGFVFSSGLKLMLHADKKFSCKQFYLGRLKTVLVPYILWVAVYYFYFIHKGYFAFSLADFAKYVLNGSLVGHFYFVVAIVQFYLLAPLWRVLVKKTNTYLLLAAALLVTLLSPQIPTVLNALHLNALAAYNDRIFTTYIIYWIFGCVAGKAYAQFKEQATAKTAVITAAAVLFLAADCVLFYLNSVNIFYFKYLEALHVFYCLFAITAVFAAMCRLHEPQNAAVDAVFKLLDRSTYNIYLCHCLVVFVVNEFMTRAGIASVTKRLALRFCTVYALTLLACVLWQLIKQTVRRNRRLHE